MSLFSLVDGRGVKSHYFGEDLDFLQLLIFKNKKLFPRIILESKGVKTHYFNEDLDVITRNYLQE